jgi:hypothetical protein
MGIDDQDHPDVIPVAGKGVRPTRNARDAMAVRSADGMKVG